MQISRSCAVRNVDAIGCSVHGSCGYTGWLTPCGMCDDTDSVGHNYYWEGPLPCPPNATPITPHNVHDFPNFANVSAGYSQCQTIEVGAQWRNVFYLTSGRLKELTFLRKWCVCKNHGDLILQVYVYFLNFLAVVSLHTVLECINRIILLSLTYRARTYGGRHIQYEWHRFFQFPNAEFLHLEALFPSQIRLVFVIAPLRDIYVGNWQYSQHSLLNAYSTLYDCC